MHEVIEFLWSLEVSRVAGDGEGLGLLGGLRAMWGESNGYGLLF